MINNVTLQILLLLEENEVLIKRKPINIERIAIIDRQLRLLSDLLNLSNPKSIEKYIIDKLNK